MLPKVTIKRFLAQPRQDYRPYKNLSFAQLEDLCDRLPIEPPIWDPLRKHQRVCLLVAAKTRRFQFNLDTGTGKTFLSVAIAEYFKTLGVNNRFLVLVPNIINKYEWAREIRKHNPSTTYCILSGSTKDKWEALQSTDALIVLETYGGFLRMLTELQQVKVKKRGKAKMVPKLRPQKRLIREMLKHVDGLIMDESTNVANSRALPYRLCRQIAKNVETVFGLSGTPFGRDPVMLWAQMNLIDNGETLGKTLGLFREALFNAKENFWGGYDYSFPKRNRPILHRMMANRSLRYVAKESDLPRVVSIIKEIRLGVEAKTYYERAKQALIAAKGNFHEMKNPFLRLRQISSGFVGYHDDEEGVRAQFEFKNNPKLELLLSIIQSIRPDRKIIVFHDFIFSGSIISRELEKLDIGHVRLIRKTKDPSELLHRFDHDPKCRVFILSTAGAFGLNLQIAKYGIFYESPVSVINRKQMQRRVERQGSLHDKVFVYDLIVRGTADQSILNFHKEGKDMFKGIIEGQP